MKTKIAIILVAIILFAYFIFNTWLVVNWFISKREAKTTKQVMAKGIGSFSYHSEKGPYWVMEEKGDTLKILKENEFEIKYYIRLK
jgi:hypothetical protein